MNDEEQKRIQEIQNRYKNFNINSNQNDNQNNYQTQNTSYEEFKKQKEEQQSVYKENIYEREKNNSSGMSLGTAIFVSILTLFIIGTTSAYYLDAFDDLFNTRNQEKDTIVKTDNDSDKQRQNISDNPNIEETGKLENINKTMKEEEKDEIKTKIVEDKWYISNIKVIYDKNNWKNSHMLISDDEDLCSNNLGQCKILFDNKLLKLRLNENNVVSQNGINFIRLDFFPEELNLLKSGKNTFQFYNLKKESEIKAFLLDKNKLRDKKTNKTQYKKDNEKNKANKSTPYEKCLDSHTYTKQLSSQKIKIQKHTITALNFEGVSRSGIYYIMMNKEDINDPEFIKIEHVIPGYIFGAANVVDGEEIFHYNLDKKYKGIELIRRKIKGRKSDLWSYFIKIDKRFYKDFRGIKEIKVYVKTDASCVYTKIKLDFLEPVIVYKTKYTNTGKAERHLNEYSGTYIDFLEGNNIKNWEIIVYGIIKNNGLWNYRAWSNFDLSEKDINKVRMHLWQGTEMLSYNEFYSIFFWSHQKYGTGEDEYLYSTKIIPIPAKNEEGELSEEEAAKKIILAMGHHFKMSSWYPKKRECVDDTLDEFISVSKYIHEYQNIKIPYNKLDWKCFYDKDNDEYTLSVANWCLEIKGSITKYFGGGIAIDDVESGPGCEGG